jgi:hypothetical protein
MWPDSWAGESVRTWMGAPRGLGPVWALPLPLEALPPLALPFEAPTTTPDAAVGVEGGPPAVAPGTTPAIPTLTSPPLLLARE